MKKFIALLSVLVFLPIWSMQPDIEDLYEQEINRGRVMEYIKDHPLQTCCMVAVGLYIPLSLIYMVHQYHVIAFYEDLIEVKLKKVDDFYKILKPYLPFLKKIV